MKKTLAIGWLAIALAACHPPVAPQVLQEWQTRTLFTCCNIYYGRPEVSDANYHAGSVLPFGSPAAVQKMTSDSLTFGSGATTLTLVHSYGRNQENGQQYFSKILVPTDPHTVFATYPRDVQSAIENGRVEVGMTKEQVLMSLGYPPTHRTASTDLNTWMYWFSRAATYQVIFGDTGTVASVVGNAPTSNQPIVAPTPTPAPRPVRRGKTK